MGHGVKREAKEATGIEQEYLGNTPYINRDRTGASHEEEKKDLADRSHICDDGSIGISGGVIPRLYQSQRSAAGRTKCRRKPEMDANARAKARI